MKGPRKRLGRGDLVAVCAVTAVAAELRLLRLSQPAKLVFDETYYAPDSCYYARGLRACGLDGAPVEVHPPLGKWLLSIGTKLFGFDAFGYRIVAAFAGIATIVLLYLLARKLLGSTLGATLASGLLALDPLHFVQSRIAMLDVFVSLFGVAAVLCSMHDRDLTLEGPRSRARPWRIAAGLMAGAAVAAKWSGISYLVLVAGLTVAWEVAARRRRPDERGAVPATGASIVICFVLLPALVYVGSYAGRLEGSLLALPWSDGSWLHALWDKQADMMSFHLGLEASHPYQSPAWSWILVKRPMSYFYETTRSGDSLAIMAVGNIVVWWSSIPALVATAYRWLRRRKWTGPEGVIVAGFVLTYGPWLVQGTGRQALFIFYLLPALPFMMLALAYVATSIAGTWEGRAAIGLFVALAVGYFAYFYPVLAARPLAYDDFRRRILFEQCRALSQDEPPAEEADPPPEEGWCWL